MANVARFQLDRAERELLRDVIDSNPGKAGKIAAAYKINARRLEDWAGGGPMSRKVHLKFQRLVRRVREDRTSALAECGISDSHFPASVEMAIGIARSMTDRNHSPAALGVLLDAFGSMSSVEGAMPMLSEIIYTGYRHCRTDPFCLGMETEILPRLQPLVGRLRTDDVLRWTCASQITCALNEGGRDKDAGGYFGASWAKQLLSHRDAPGWLEPQFMRNRAHHGAWYADTATSLRDVRSLLLDVQRRNASVQNQHSSAHSLCDLFLARRKYADGWTAIAEKYGPIRDHLRECRPGIPTLPVSLMLSFSMYLSGTIARAVTGADGYTDAELRVDIGALGYWLNRLGGTAECGHPRELPADHERIPPEFRQIIRRCWKQMMTDEQASTLKRLADLLVT